MPDETYSILTFQATEVPDAYKAFIHAQWKHTLRHGNEYYKLIDSQNHGKAFYEAYQHMIEKLFHKPDATFRIAVLTSTPDVMLGFCLYRRDILDYCVIRKDARQKGIGSSLIPSGIKTITHLTKLAMRLWAKEKYKHLVFNPFV